MNTIQGSGIRNLLADRRLVLFTIAACLVPLGYALYTNQIWEDALITLRHAENLLKGEGLNFYPGRRIHGFTSALNVMLLALGSLVTGQTSYQATLWVYRVFTIVAFAAAGILSIQALRMVTSANWRIAVGFFAVCYLFDAKSVAYSANGQEVAFMLLSLAGALYLFAQDQPQRWRARGICWAGLMYTRPDGCVYVAILSLAEILFSSLRRKQVFVSLLKSAALCALLYSPWFISTWWYYGSPIPNTVLAKRNVIQGTTGQILVGTDLFFERLVGISSEVFRPIYASLGGSRWFESHAWSRVLNTLTKCAGVFCLMYWLFPVKDRLGRMASFCFTAAVLYLSCLVDFRYPWYFPQIEFFGLVTLARGMPTLADAYSNRESGSAVSKPVRSLVLALMFLLAISQIALFGLTMYQARIQQTEVEMGNRAQIGLWLRDHALPGQSVLLEPLGYIGYFSNLKMLDWPGLVAPEVVRLRGERKAASMSALIPDLQPDWVVLRSWEYDQLLESPALDFFQKNYTLVKFFDVTSKLNQYSFIPGKAYVYFDAVFALFKRNDAQTQSGEALPSQGK